MKCLVRYFTVFPAQYWNLFWPINNFFQQRFYKMSQLKWHLFLQCRFVFIIVLLHIRRGWNLHNSCILSAIRESPQNFGIQKKNISSCNLKIKCVLCSWASFIKCCATTILNLILWSFLIYAYVISKRNARTENAGTPLFQMWNLWIANDLELSRWKLLLLNCMLSCKLSALLMIPN